MNENWTAVPGYEGLYEVSNLGNFKTLGGRIGSWHKRPIKMRVKKDGYLYARLCRNSSPKDFGAHRLVALAYIPNPENKKEVNHKNSNPQDNQVENLEWVTPVENMQHALKRNGEWRRGRGNAINCRSQEISVCHPPLPAVGVLNQCKSCYMVDYHARTKEKRKLMRKTRESKKSLP